MNKLLVIAGPTATGKTKLALGLAGQFNGELVSADSRQVYRGMDVGTGKDLPDKLRITNHELRIQFEKKSFRLQPYEIDGIPVWLYDVVLPNEEFNVAQYQKLGRGVIADIHGRGKLPIAVGGTGLYLKALTGGVQAAAIPPDFDLRQKLQSLTRPELQAMLKRVGPQTWTGLNDSDRQNPRRLVRKIELAINQRVYGSVAASPPRLFDVLTIGLTAPRSVLYRRIDQRIERRVLEGILDELAGLLAKGYSWGLPSMSGLGYREWKPYFEIPNPEKHKLKGKIIQQWKYDEHAYARRQLTWFKKQAAIRWFDITDKHCRKKVEGTVDAWYTQASYDHEN